MGGFYLAFLHKNNYNKIQTRINKKMYRLVQSQLFSGLAHPNSLQCFGAYPEDDYRREYDKLAKALKSNNMYIEQSSGLAINYGDSRLGMNTEMLRCMIQNDVQIITASDAHIPQKVGMLVCEMNRLIDGLRCREE